MNRIGEWVLNLSVVVFFIVACLLFVATPVVRADSTAIVSEHETFKNIGIPNLAAAPANVYLSEPRAWGKSSVQALDWDLLCTDAGTPRLVCEIEQSNSFAGPFTLWSNPSLAGVTVNNSMTLVTRQDGTGLYVTPSGFYRLRLINIDTSAVTATRIGVLKP